MPYPIAFVEELAEVELGPNGIRIVAKSGDEVFAFRCERSLWRQFLEREIRALNAFEEAERRKRKVVKIAERGH